jgi:signal transduction histidine kinase
MRSPKSHNQKYSLKTKLSLSIAFVALFTVVLISILSNVFIRRRFEDYIAKQRQQRIDEIVSDIRQQYDVASKTWDVTLLHTIGMLALQEGYILRVYDPQGMMLWDAEFCDMEACIQVMEEITRQMRRRYPGVDGSFIRRDSVLEQNGQEIAKVGIGYFAPYFLNENDFLFLDGLNVILVGCGFFALALAAAAGWLLARNVSDPIRKTVDVAKRMSAGDYVVRLEDESNIRELDELRLAVNHLATSIGSQEGLRKQLTADVAHELRTPLTTIGTHIEAMMEGLWEPTRERLSSCYEEILRIGRLVLDMENLAKVESGNLKLDKTRVALRELAEKTLHNFEAEISGRSLHASVTGSCSEVSVDRDRISQVLVNLVSNAVKYARPGGMIRVILSETEEAVRLDVEDDGIGISEEDLAFVFERFYRSEKSRSRMGGGSGIGLAIVRSIVAAHGGTVGVKSALNLGSRFHVELPRAGA